jgi:heme o synthase
MPRLVRYAWFVLGLNVFVILLGALVRATGSGAGCGRSWPGCQGTFIPELEGDTLVEFTHRAASGVALIFVFVLFVWIRRATEPGHPARFGAGLSVVAIVGEALIGAMIVLAEWVGDDASTARVVAVPLHLVNTLFLLAALTLTIHWLTGGGKLRWAEAPPRVRRAVILGAIALVLIAATGAVTALADTLFPKGGDLSDEAHFLTGLRIVHPILAAVSVMAAWVVATVNGAALRAGSMFPILVGAMIVTGVVNVMLGVPVWMQLVHLGLADALWVVFVMTAARALAGGSVRPQIATGTGVRGPGGQPGLPD